MDSTVRSFYTRIRANDSSLIFVVDNGLLSPIDISAASGLKDVAFEWKSNSHWVAMALRTVTRDHGNLQQISLRTHWESYGMNLLIEELADIARVAEETSHPGWLELDNLLAQLWESYSIRPRLIYPVPAWMNRRKAGRRVESLLSGVTGRGTIDLIEEIDEPEGRVLGSPTEP